MDSLRHAAVTLALMGAVLPLKADSSSPGKSQAANLANIRAQFAAKDATIADLQRQVTEQAARIADLQKQAAVPPPAAPPAATFPVPDKAARLSLDLPAMPVTAALASLSRKAGVPILTDDTVEGALAAMSVNQPGLEPALDQLKTAVPGLSWQKVYLPKDLPLPKGNALSQQVQALKALSPASLAISDAATQSLVSLSRKKVDPAASLPTAGMQIVYLVTNETVRTQRQASQKTTDTVSNPAPAALPAPLPDATGQNPVGQNTVGQAVSGLQGASEMLGRMTPDEQRQALPLMFQQFTQMMQKIDPSVRRELFQQWQQFRP